MTNSTLTPQIENHETFRRRLGLRYTPRQIELIDFAYDLSKYSHHKQKRRTGERFFEHLRGTALILMDELGVFDFDIVVGAVLHDSVEDSFLLTIPRIGLIFGDRSAKIVDGATKRLNESDEEFFARIYQSDEVGVWIVKCVDRIHNLRDMSADPIEKIIEKMDETDRIYIPLALMVAEVYGAVGNDLWHKLNGVMMPYQGKRFHSR